MRILHVSDLHLGRGLGDLSREAEQRALVAEIAGAAEEHGVSLTVISGDVFDAFTPPAWAEDLFFQLLDGLAGGGRRAVAVIAGNHDSGTRLAAADPLARRLGIMLAGDVGDELRGHDGGAGVVRVTPLATQVARVEVPGANAPIVIGLLPFLSEAKVAREGDGAQLASIGGDGSRYAERLAREARERAIMRDPKAIHVLVMHQQITGGAPSDSERRLRVGGLSDLEAHAIPAGLDYVALGHLHRPQTVQGAGSLAVYAGSPIAYSFSESGQTKRAVLVDVAPGRPAMLTDVPLRSGRPLEIWAVGSIEEALSLAALPRGSAPIVEIRASLGRLLTPMDADALFTLPGGATVVSVRDLHLEGPAPLPREVGEAELPELRVEELFRELWQKKNGDEPDLATMEELSSALIELGQGELDALPPLAEAHAGATALSVAAAPAGGAR